MLERSFSVVDIEVTEQKEIIQIAIVNLDKKLNIVDKYNYFFKPKSKLSSFVSNLTGISDKQLEDKPSFKEIAHEIYSKIKNNILVCHGVVQDYNTLKDNFEKNGINYIPVLMLDTVELTKLYFPTQFSYRLGDIAENLELKFLGDCHNAAVDVDLTVQLLKHIITKINTIQEKNFIGIKSLLKKYNDTLYWFSTYFRNNDFEFKKSNLMLRNNLYFKKIKFYNKDFKSSRYIFLSSIEEKDFIKYNLQNIKKEIVILNNKGDYIPCNFFKIFKKNILEFQNSGAYTLIIKLLVWIQETNSGNFNELNLDLSEVYQLSRLKEYFEEENYYYDMTLQNALLNEYIVTNYTNLTDILANNYFKNDIFVYEDKNILGLQIKRLCTNIIVYREVVTELNIAINETRDKKIVVIQKNIEDLINYLHEMYVAESLELYNEAIKFLVNDVEYVIQEISNLKTTLIKTKIFLNNLLLILHNNSKGYYTFSSISSSSSMIIKVNNYKKEKILINKIYNNKIKFLENIVKVENYRKKVNIFKKDNFIIDLNMKKLYIFNSSKYKELYYANRDKKSNVKFKKYSLDDDFATLFKDIIKNSKLGYACYANQEIMAYKIYLTLLFDEIITVSSLEY